MRVIKISKFPNFDQNSQFSIRVTYIVFFFLANSRMSISWNEDKELDIYAPANFLINGKPKSISTINNEIPKYGEDVFMLGGFGKGLEPSTINTIDSSNKYIQVISSTSSRFWYEYLEIPRGDLDESRTFEYPNAGILPSNWKIEDVNMSQFHQSQNVSSLFIYPSHDNERISQINIMLEIQIGLLKEGEESTDGKYGVLQIYEDTSTGDELDKTFIENLGGKFDDYRVLKNMYVEIRIDSMKEPGSKSNETLTQYFVAKPMFHYSETYGSEESNNPKPVTVFWISQSINPLYNYNRIQFKFIAISDENSYYDNLVVRIGRTYTTSKITKKYLYFDIEDESNNQLENSVHNEE